LGKPYDIKQWNYNESRIMGATKPFTFRPFIRPLNLFTNKSTSTYYNNKTYKNQLSEQKYPPFYPPFHFFVGRSAKPV